MGGYLLPVRPIGKAGPFGCDPCADCGKRPPTETEVFMLSACLLCADCARSAVSRAAESFTTEGAVAMSTTLDKAQRGLDANVPNTGRAADAYAVACTASMLQGRNFPAGVLRHSFEAARHATTLHLLSGQLHRIAERQCNEDLACPRCNGDGYTHQPSDGPRATKNEPIPCRTCAGHGHRLGRRLERLRRDARQIAEHYGLRPYFQTDPRGCSLYLIAPEIIPADLPRHPGESFTTEGE